MTDQAAALAADAVLPTVPDRSPEQVAYDEQLVAAIQSGDQTKVAQLKGQVQGLSILAEVDPEFGLRVTVTRPETDEPGVVQWGDGDTADMDTGVRQAIHTFPRPGQWTVLVQQGGQSGQATVTTTEPVKSSKKK